MNFNFIKTAILSCCIIFFTSVSLFANSNHLSVNEFVYQSNNKTFLHTIAKGETVYSIAKTYGISPNDIYDLNPKAYSTLKLGENLIIPDRSNNKNVRVVPNNTTSYSVKSKETLYSLSKQFGITVNDIIQANPSLATSSLHEGQIIQIPNSKDVSSVMTEQQNRFIEHNVSSKETIYGIAKQYNVTPEALIEFNPELKNGLKQNSKIMVPIFENSTAITNNSDLQANNTLFNIATINIGVILPILNKSNGQSARFLEYYEGFLLALKEMKAKGLSANVYVFDMGSETGTTKLRSLLDTYEMKNLDLIIGGVSPEQVSTISSFAKREGIKYAIPFPTKTDVASNNNQVFQVNGTHANLNSSVINAFTNRFADANVILLTSNSANDKKDLLTNLSVQLSRHGISPKTVTINPNLTANLLSAIDYKKKNVIVPSSGSSGLLQSILPSLNQISSDHPNVSITLFGHTEWQTYPQFFADFNKYDTYIYTPFYLVDDAKTNQFITSYKRWYGNKSLINTFPKYGMLGYDTGIYFLTALQKYGKNFETSISNNSVQTLQTPFFFEKTNASGGYVNTGFYFIHYKPEGSVEKIEYTK